MSLPEVQAQPAIKARLLQGHPWVYRNQVSGGERLRSGAWVRVRCGGYTAVGLWDATSPIAVRLFSRRHVPDADWIGKRICEAWEIRAALRNSDTNAYRWIYGEGDGLPGLVVDRYGDYAIIQTYAESLAALAPLVVPSLRTCDPGLRGIVMREARGEPSDGRMESDEKRAQSTAPGANLQVAWGEAPPTDLVIQEHGLYFHANLYTGQKTGLFLDQRENRRLVESLACGLRVLNCFAYTGAFSIYALRGDAVSVVSADIGHGLAEATASNLALNRLSATQHSFVTDDCFALLDIYAKEGRRFDMVILDPPSFARTKANLYAAIRAYVRLNALAMRCLEPGGLLVSASCTSQIGPDAFRTILADAAMQASRRLLIVHEVGQPLDHPVPAGFPEGRYLKCVVGRTLTIP